MTPRGRSVAGILACAALAVCLQRPSTAAPAPLGADAGLVAAGWTPVPSYAVAAHDEPVTYRNGCHAWRPVTRPRACTILNPTAGRTVLLFGDSHAAHWYAAVRTAARAHDWHMLYLTKSSCPAADVAVRGYRMTTDYPQCSTWRGRALKAIAERRWGHVDVAVVSNWHVHTVLSSPHGHRLTAGQRVAAWEAGMRRTLRAILRGARQVLLLRDSPDLPGDAATARTCYARNGLAAQRRCGATTATALRAGIWKAEQRAAASFAGRVSAVDLTTPTCPDRWCGPISGPYLAFKDDNHWTQTYVRAHFSAPVDRELQAAMARS